MAESCISFKFGKAELLQGLLATLWHKQLGTDLFFKCSDGGSVGAHLALIKLFCPKLGAWLPSSHELIPGVCPAATIIVPGFSKKIVKSFVKMLYTGSTDKLTIQEIEQVQAFGHTHLGFNMILNWNISVEMSYNEDPSLPIPSLLNTSVSNIREECYRQLSNSAVTHKDVDHRSMTKSGGSSENNCLVIDDNETSSPTHSRWCEDENPESQESQTEAGGDPLYDAESENEYYDHQDYEGNMAEGSESADALNGSKLRRKRTSISKIHLMHLRSAFELDPFPSRATINQLTAETGLPFRVVRVWFQNERAKSSRRSVSKSGNCIVWTPKLVKSGGNSDNPLEIHSDHESSGTLDSHHEELSPSNANRSKTRFISPGVFLSNQASTSRQHEEAVSPIRHYSTAKQSHSGLKRNPSEDIFERVTIKREPLLVDENGKSFFQDDHRRRQSESLNNAYICNWSNCNKTFRHSENLHRHVLEHTTQASAMKFPCEKCRHVFYSREQLENHYQEYHNHH